MSKRLNDIVMTAVLAGTTMLGGCAGMIKTKAEYEREFGPQRKPSAGALLAAVGTANAMGAKTPEEAQRWAAAAEYGRAEANRDAAEAANPNNGRREESNGNNSGGQNNNNGIVVIQLEDGRVYRGESLNGWAHGTGKLQYPDGDWFEGQFEKGKKVGYGIYHQNDGGISKGVYKDGERDGSFEYADSKGKTSTWYYLKDKIVTKEEYDKLRESNK